jgi:hypothetical protein
VFGGRHSNEMRNQFSKQYRESNSQSPPIPNSKENFAEKLCQIPMTLTHLFHKFSKRTLREPYSPSNPAFFLFLVFYDKKMTSKDKEEKMEEDYINLQKYVPQTKFLNPNNLFSLKSSLSLTNCHRHPLGI